MTMTTSDKDGIPKTSNITTKDSRKRIHVISKIKFLQRCSKTDVLLPSNFHGGIDRDILLIQQATKLKEDIRQLQSDLTLLKSQPQSNLLNRYKDKIKKHLISKYEKLYKKQYNCQNVKKREKITDQK